LLRTAAKVESVSNALGSIISSSSRPSVRHHCGERYLCFMNPYQTLSKHNPCPLCQIMNGIEQLRGNGNGEPCFSALMKSFYPMISCLTLCLALSHCVSFSSSHELVRDDSGKKVRSCQIFQWERGVPKKFSSTEQSSAQNLKKRSAIGKLN
jgi:hypothetical protein